VATPQASDYETLGIYVPGAYFTGKDNGNGTYTVTVNASGTVGSFTAATAPTVFPVNTPGYSAQKPPTEYSYDTIKAYMEAGFIYVLAGLRGKDSNSQTYSGNAPWGVADLKAAARQRRARKEMQQDVPRAAQHREDEESPLDPAGRNQRPVDVLR